MYIRSVILLIYKYTYTYIFLKNIELCAHMRRNMYTMFYRKERVYSVGIYAATSIFTFTFMYTLLFYVFFPAVVKKGCACVCGWRFVDVVGSYIYTHTHIEFSMILQCARQHTQDCMFARGVFFSSTLLRFFFVFPIQYMYVYVHIFLHGLLCENVYRYRKDAQMASRPFIRAVFVLKISRISRRTASSSFVAVTFS